MFSVMIFFEPHMIIIKHCGSSKHTPICLRVWICSIQIKWMNLVLWTCSWGRFFNHSLMETLFLIVSHFCLLEHKRTLQTDAAKQVQMWFTEFGVKNLTDLHEPCEPIIQLQLQLWALCRSLQFLTANPVKNLFIDITSCAEMPF